MEIHNEANRNVNCLIDAVHGALSKHTLSQSVEMPIVNQMTMLF